MCRGDGPNQSGDLIKETQKPAWRERVGDSRGTRLTGELNGYYGGEAGGVKDLYAVCLHRHLLA